MEKIFIKIMFFIVLSTLISCSNINKQQIDISPNDVIPTSVQVEYQQMETIGFIHFTVNTFTNKEWGFGDENPEIFNPAKLDVEQWVTTAKSAGLKELLLTAKHHDGFCLWPSKYTEHSIKNSLYKNGNGDIVREFVDACKKHGLKVGLYLSPWDRNHKDYGRSEYIIYYRNQLKELLTQYGEINEIWFDGANGGDGYYGGAFETRKIDRSTYYDWDSTFALVKELQPNISIFSDAGPDVHWIGNEKGFAGDSFWSPIKKDKLIIGSSDPEYLNSGDPEGTNWIVGQCDVSIRPGWFYHKAEDSLVKSPQELVDIYYKSVGRNSILLLNIPPNDNGLISKDDVNSLLAFKQIIEETFSINLATGASVTANNYRLNSEYFSPQKVLDNDLKTYWATNDSIFPAVLVIELNEETLFDRIMIQEPIKLGQRINKFQIEVKNKGEWELIYEGTTIGYKKLIRINPTTAFKVRLKIIQANNTVAISNLGLFKSSAKENSNDSSISYN